MGLRGKFLEIRSECVRKKAIWGCGVGLGCLGFAGGLGVLVQGSAASLGPIGRCRFVMGLSKIPGIRLECEKDGDFGGVGWVWALRVGWGCWCGTVL